MRTDVLISIRITDSWFEPTQYPQMLDPTKNCPWLGTRSKENKIYFSRLTSNTQYKGVTVTLYINVLSNPLLVINILAIARAPLCGYDVDSPFVRDGSAPETDLKWPLEGDGNIRKSAINGY